MKTHLSQVDHQTVVSLNSAEGDPVLTPNQVYISNPTSVIGYTHITGFIFSDVSSVLNGLIIEQAMSLSDFPANLPATANVTRSLFTVTGNELVTNNYSVQIVAPFVRIIYTNGLVGQATFRAFFQARILRGL